MLRAPLTAGTTISPQVLISKFIGDAVWMIAVTPRGGIRRALGVDIGVGRTFDCYVECARVRHHRDGVHLDTICVLFVGAIDEGIRAVLCS